jgi:Fur family zinc uptake transcriptional regulator
MPCEDHGVCITTALEVADRIRSEKQLKITKLRKDILRMIWEEYVPQKAYDLLGKFQTTNHSAKLATVYHTLDFLLKNGFSHKVASLNAFVGCSDPLNHEEC